MWLKTPDMIKTPHGAKAVKKAVHETLKLLGDESYFTEHPETEQGKAFHKWLGFKPNEDNLIVYRSPNE
jgi:hypothetical protein